MRKFLEKLFRVSTVASHTLLLGSVEDGMTVVDLGANRGEFYDSLREKGVISRYVAVEPTPSLAERLRGRDDFEVVEAAVANVDGEANFSINENCEGSSISSDSSPGVPVRAIRFETLLSTLGMQIVDLLKVDVEGAERDVFHGTSPEVLRRCLQIAVEFHDFCGVYPTSETRRMIDRLRESGFVGIRFSRNNTNWLFVQPRSASQKVRVFLAKWAIAPSRRLKHLLLP